MSCNIKLMPRCEFCLITDVKIDEAGNGTGILSQRGDLAFKDKRRFPFEPPNAGTKVFFFERDIHLRIENCADTLLISDDHVGFDLKGKNNHMTNIIAAAILLGLVITIAWLIYREFNDND